MRQVKSSDVLIVMGDFNAKVGKSHQPPTTGKYGLGEQNDRGERLIQFCEEHNLVIGNTFFQHPQRRLYTSSSPGDMYRNQIDFIMIKGRFKNSFKQVKTYPGADIYSDHNPVVATIALKLKKTQNTRNGTKKYDLSTLQRPDIQHSYAVEVKNRYETLLKEDTEQHESDVDKIEAQWKNIKESIQHANEEILHRKERKAKHHG